MGSWLRRDDGQAVPLVVALAGLAVVLTFALGELAADVVDAGRARTAADAAALAAVHGGHSAAARLAARHDATLIAWSRSGSTVTVTVRIGDATAVASATGGDLGSPTARWRMTRPRSGRTVAYTGSS